MKKVLSRSKSTGRKLFVYLRKCYVSELTDDKFYCYGKKT